MLSGVEYFTLRIGSTSYIVATASQGGSSQRLRLGESWVLASETRAWACSKSGDGKEQWHWAGKLVGQSNDTRINTRMEVASRNPVCASEKEWEEKKGNDGIDGRAAQDRSEYAMYISSEHG